MNIRTPRIEACTHRMPRIIHGSAAFLEQTFRINDNIFPILFRKLLPNFFVFQNAKQRND